MAKLIVPKIAVRGPDSRGKTNGKWHLLQVHGKYGNQGVTMCKFFYDDWEKIPISKIKAGDLCQRCLGAMEVTD